MLRPSLHRVVGQLALVLGTVAAASHPSGAQAMLRVSLAELKADLDRGGDPIVLFSSDDPDCGFCTPANAEVPVRVRRVTPDAALWMVSWSPWRSFPPELETVLGAGRLAGVPAVVRYANGREIWRVTGHSPALMAELESRLRAESGGRVVATAAPTGPTAAAPAPRPASPAPSAGAVATLRLAPASHTMFWGNALRPDLIALDSAGRPVAVASPRWSSSDTTVASVGTDGLVTAHRRGTATITVTAAGRSSSMALTVAGFRQLGRAAASLPCAIADDRVGVFCWGNTRILPTARLSPALDAPAELRRGDIPADARIRSVVTESQHGCVLTEAGSLHCWGQQKDGALGVGDLTPRDVPTRVARGELPAVARITDVAIGPHGTCAIADERSLYCWGARGALPVRDSFRTNDRLLQPVATERGELPASARLTSVAVSINGGCVIADGAPYCWKRGTRVPGPVRVERGDLPPGVTMQMLQSDDFTCGSASDGRAYCWGAARGHRFGVGNDTFRQQATPLQVAPGAVPGGVTLTRVSLGSGVGASCALGSDGEAYCWGAGGNGAAGDGDASRHVVMAPIRVLAGDRTAGVRYVDLNCGEQFCTALGDDGVLYGWGTNIGEMLARDSQSLRLATAPLRANAPRR